MPVAVNEKVYDISINLKMAFVFELWIGCYLAARLKMLSKRLSYFGIFEKQNSLNVKPQRVAAG